LEEAVEEQLMDNLEYERAHEHSYEDAGQQTGLFSDQDRLMLIAGGLSVVFAAIAGILLILARRRPPTRIQRAEASLISAAQRAEQAARLVRKQGPGLVERGAGSVEQAARMVRKQGPGLVVKGGERVEQWGRTIRKRGPNVVARGAERVEQAARMVRKQAPSMVANSPRAPSRPPG